MIRLTRHKMCFDAIMPRPKTKPAQDMLRAFVRTYDVQPTTSTLTSNPANSEHLLALPTSQYHDDEQNQKEKNHPVCIIVGPPGRRRCHPGAADRGGIPRTRGTSIVGKSMHVPPMRLFFFRRYIYNKAESRGSQPRPQKKRQRQRQQ